MILESEIGEDDGIMHSIVADFIHDHFDEGETVDEDMQAFIHDDDVAIGRCMPGPTRPFFLAPRLGFGTDSSRSLLSEPCA